MAEIKRASPSESSFLELNKSSDEWLDSVMNATSTQSRHIPKVPQMLHNMKDFEKHYEPRVVSIGLYHLGNTNLQTVQKLKFKIAKKFAFENRDTLKNLYDKVLKLTRDSKLCTWYEEYCSIDNHGYLSDETFAQIMVLDGCFVLYYIECVLNNGRKGQKPDVEDLEMKSHDVAFVQQDIFLLENQLPFCVLKVLTEARPFWGEAEQYMSHFDTFILNCVLDYSQESRRPSCWHSSLYMLKHLFSLLVTSSKKRTAELSSEPLNQKTPEPVHLLQHLQHKLVGTGKNKAQPEDNKIRSTLFNKKKRPESQGTNNRYTFRNVDELLGVGIHFRPSRSKHLSAIKYTPGKFYTYLELPPITVDDSTRAMLLNLIAYEMCSDSHTESWVTSYVCFLDSLIDHPEDVKVLRSAGILHNCLGSDEEVSHLFNDIGYDLVPNPTAYDEVKRQIQEHYTRPTKTWMAQLTHEHFKSPWSILALLGALIALFLSGVQAYFSVWSLPSDCEGLCRYIRTTHHL